MAAPGDHGLENAQRKTRADKGRCTRVFVPLTADGSRTNYRRTCLCGGRKDHEPPHRCPACGGTWEGP